jgi:hypothetical protein
MDARHWRIQILGWLSAIAGYGLALLFIRGIIIGITRGFGAGRSQVFWIALGYLLFFALAVYLVDVGRRGISHAKGFPRPKMRFGWGKILIGSTLMYSYTVSHFHLIPVRYKPLQASNNAQATAMNITQAIVFIGCVLLILSGVWEGLRRRRQPSLGV